MRAYYPHSLQYNLSNEMTEEKQPLDTANCFTNYSSLGLGKPTLQSQISPIELQMCSIHNLSDIIQNDINIYSFYFYNTALESFNTDNFRDVCDHKMTSGISIVESIAAKAGEHVQKGWCESAYVVSKNGVNALTFIQHRKFNQNPDMDIVVNAVHPGYVDTDMSSHKGPLTPDQGAEASVYCALLPPGVESPRGEFIWNDKKITPWLPK